MWERKLLNIYAEDYENPTIIVAYTIDKEKARKKTIKDFSVWVRKDKRDNIDIVNHANMIYRSAYLYPKEPISEKRIYSAYQFLFAERKWENYFVESEFHDNYKLLITKKPHLDFERLTENSMTELVLRKLKIKQKIGEI